MTSNQQNIPKLIPGLMNTNIHESFNKNPMRSVLTNPQVQQILANHTLDASCPVLQTGRVPSKFSKNLDASCPVLQTGWVPPMQQLNTISIFGQVFKKTHVYIVGTIVLIIVVYMIWSHYKKKWMDDGDSDDDDDDDENIGHAHQLQYMPASMYHRMQGGTNYNMPPHQTLHKQQMPDQNTPRIPQYQGRSQQQQPQPQPQPQPQQPQQRPQPQQPQQQPQSQQPQLQQRPQQPVPKQPVPQQRPQRQSQQQPVLQQHQQLQPRTNKQFNTQMDKIVQHNIDV